MNKEETVKLLADALYYNGGGYMARGAGGRTQFYGPREMMREAEIVYQRLVDAGVIAPEKEV